VPGLGDVIKRRARRDECGTNEWNIAEELAGEDWRLVTLDGGSGDVTAEVAHEQLLRTWPILAEWVEEQRKFLTWKSDLEGTRLFYESTPASEKTTALLMGYKLFVARGWFDIYRDDLAPEDRKFILDSIAEDDKQREEREQARHQAKKAQIRTEASRLTAAVMTGAFGAFALEHLFGISWSSNFSFNLSLHYALIGLAMLFGLVLITQVLQITTISRYLTLAEREMNSLLRGLSGERAEWLSMIPVSTSDQFFELNQEPPDAAVGKARLTAFLLREIYEGNVKNAQKKIEAETKAHGRPPFIAPGVRELVGFDEFAMGRFPQGAGVSWLPLMMAVKLNRYPQNIIMVRADKTVAYNWAVIDELTRQLKSAAM
jgi:hypothetical protein